MIVVDDWVIRQARRAHAHRAARRAASGRSTSSSAAAPAPARRGDRLDRWVGVAWLIGDARIPDAGRVRHRRCRRPLGEWAVERRAPAWWRSRRRPRRSWRWWPARRRRSRPRLAGLQSRGRCAGDENDLHAARILAGWPALGAEIDERTLPQEVRYDEIGGVSYTKGCYTGQETVARLHFRGHTNRELRGLRWRGPGRSRRPGRRCGGARRSARCAPRSAVDGRAIGLAIVRREVGPGDERRGGRAAGEGGARCRSAEELELDRLKRLRAPGRCPGPDRTCGTRDALTSRSCPAPWWCRTSASCQATFAHAGVGRSGHLAGGLGGGASSAFFSPQAANARTAVIKSSFFIVYSLRGRVAVPISGSSC